MGKIYQVKVDGKIYEVDVEFISDSVSSNVTTPIQNTTQTIQKQETSSPVIVASGNGTPVQAPMQGNIWKILKNTGDTVKLGETILILEAMKMENNIVAPKDGTIINILVKEGDVVESNSILVELA